MYRPPLFILLPCFSCFHFGYFSNRLFPYYRLSSFCLLVLPRMQLLMQPPIFIEGPLFRGQIPISGIFSFSVTGIRIACNSKKAPDSFPKARHKGPSTGQCSSTEGIFWSKREARGRRQQLLPSSH